MKQHLLQLNAIEASSADGVLDHEIMVFDVFINVIEATSIAINGVLDCDIMVFDVSLSAIGTAIDRVLDCNIRVFDVIVNTIKAASVANDCVSLRHPCVHICI